MKNVLESRQETGPKAEHTGEDRMSNSSRQNNKRADRKLESNDSPEIPDKGGTSEVPGLHLGIFHQVTGSLRVTAAAKLFNGNVTGVLVRIKIGSKMYLSSKINSYTHTFSAD